MEVTYLGHASFRIKSRAGSLVTDPYDPAILGVKFPKVSGDIVTVSHDHGDHNRADLVRDVRKVISGPGEYEIGGISIIGIPTFHDDKKGATRGKNTIFIFEIEDFRIAHLGDLGHKLSDSEVESLGDIDILMIPVGGKYTIGSGVAFEIVRSIEPYIIIPMHYRHKLLNTQTFGELEEIDAFLTKASLPTTDIDKLVLKGPLLEEQKVVKLKPQYA